MPLTVNLTLRGLCAFLPAEPIDHDRLKREKEKQDLTQLLVLLPDARQGGAVGPHVVCTHDPVAIFDPRPGKDGKWDIADDQVEILESDETAPGGGISVQPDFAAMTRLALAAPGTSLLQPSPGAPVVAKLALAAGSANGIEISRHLFQFRATADDPTADGPTYRDRFATAVQVLVPLAGETAIFRVTPIAGGKPRTVELRPQRGKSSVDITIQNLCADVAKSPHEPDNDFAIYYKFFPEYEGPFRIPFPIQGNPHADEVVAEAVRDGGCFPTDMS